MAPELVPRVPAKVGGGGQARRRAAVRAGASAGGGPGRAGSWRRDGCRCAVPRGRSRRAWGCGPRLVAGSLTWPCVHNTSAYSVCTSTLHNWCAPAFVQVSDLPAGFGDDLGCCPTTRKLDHCCAVRPRPGHVRFPGGSTRHTPVPSGRSRPAPFYDQDT